MTQANHALNDKVIIITGASAGVGAELTRQLNEAGAKLVLAARGEDRLRAIAEQCQDALAIPTDITDQAACQNLIDQAVAHYGRIDILINNAGISMRARFDEITDIAFFEQLMRINYHGSVYCTWAALPHLKKTRGLIAAVSSWAGKTGVPYRTGYAASKHALQGFFDTLRIELHGTGVDVSVLSLDFVDTGSRSHSLGPDGKPLGVDPRQGQKKKMISAEEAARQIIQAMEKRRREKLIGSFKGRLLPLGKIIAPGFVDAMARKSAGWDQTEEP